MNWRPYLVMDVSNRVVKTAEIIESGYLFVNQDKNRITVKEFKKMSVLKSICPKCGTIYYGWALNNPKEQICGHCGNGLEIFREGESIGISYSPSKYEITSNKTKEEK